jgi:hypothetical protein
MAVPHRLIRLSGALQPGRPVALREKFRNKVSNLELEVRSQIPFLKFLSQIPLQFQFSVVVAEASDVLSAAERLKLHLAHFLQRRACRMPN